MNETKVTFRRNELYEQVWSKPMTQLAKEFGLSDNGLRKICKKLGIPFPELGYWAKLQHGKKVHQTPLPPGHDYPETYEHIKIHWDLKPKVEVSPELQSIIDFEILPENRIQVPSTVLRSNNLVKQTRDYLKRAKPNHMGLLEPNLECLDINVSPEALERSLLISNVLISALAKRKIDVTVQNEFRKRRTCIRIWGEAIYFRISEKINQRAFSSKEMEEFKKRDPYYWGPRREYKPSGILSLKVFYGDYADPCKEFTDGKKHALEEKLNDFVISLYFVSARLKQERIERQEQEKQWELERREREDRERRIRLENLKVNLLIKQAECWQTVNTLRAFIEEVKRYSTNNKDLQDNNLETWINWASSRINDLDPLSGNFLKTWNSNLKAAKSKDGYYWDSEDE